MPSAIGNWFIKAILRSPLYPLLGGSFGLITVTGRKTGAVYATPVNALHDGDSFTVVSLKDRSWWRNLRGGRPATLRLSGKEHLVHARVIESGDEVADGLNEYLARHPGYAKYFKVRLTPDSQPVREDLERAAANRVLVRLQLEDSPENGVQILEGA